jgi:protein translocase SecG subunit
MLPLIATLLYILFVLSAIVLVVVILLQEGKGGGLTGALGTEGQQTFGVGTKGINQFTGWTCAIFLACALGIHWANRAEINKSVVGEESVLPLGPAAGAPPADGGGQTPPANGGGQTPPANGGGQTPPPANGGGEKPK